MAFNPGRICAWLSTRRANDPPSPDLLAPAKQTSTSKTYSESRPTWRKSLPFSAKLLKHDGRPSPTPGNTEPPPRSWHRRCRSPWRRSTRSYRLGSRRQPKSTPQRAGRRAGLLGCFLSAGTTGQFSSVAALGSAGTDPAGGLLLRSSRGVPAAYWRRFPLITDGWWNAFLNQPGGRTQRFVTAALCCGLPVLNLGPCCPVFLTLGWPAAGCKGLRFAQAALLDAVGVLAVCVTAEGGRAGDCPPRRLRARPSRTGSHLGGTLGHRVSRSVGRKPRTGITRAPGPGYVQHSRGPLTAYGLAQHSLRSRPAFTRELLHFVCPLFSLHPGASRWTYAVWYPGARYSPSGLPLSIALDPVIIQLAFNKLRDTARNALRAVFRI